MDRRPITGEEATPVERILGLSFLFFGITAPLTVYLSRLLVFKSPRIYVDSALHSSIEAFGAALALVTGGMLYVLHRQFHWTDKFRWAAYSMIGMGTLSGFHSVFTRDGNPMVATEILYNFWGAMIASMCLLPKAKETTPTRGFRLLLVTIALSLLVGTLVIAFQDSLPLFLDDSKFTPMCTYLSGISGLLFLLTAAKFFLDYRGTKRVKNLFIGNLFLLSGVSSTFPSTFVPWGPLWWSWHILQLLGFFAACALVGFLAIRLERRLTDSEEALQKLSDELARSNTDLERFAHVVSHDLQEPLRMISTYLSLAEKKLAGKADGQTLEQLALAQDGGKRLQVLVRDLLRFSQYGKQSLEVGQTNLQEVVDCAIANLRLTITESGAQITYNHLPMVQGHFSLLCEVVQNLIVNAIKYRSDSPPRIHFEAAQDGLVWVVSAKDNGVGIDQKFHATVFEPLKRLHGKEIPGTGMGLATSHRIIGRLKGKMWVDSAPGKGSTFFFELPA